MLGNATILQKIRKHDIYKITIYRKRMRTRRYISTLLIALSFVLTALAQEVNLTITPIRNVLPPQVMYYLSNAGQYFSVSVQNTTNETQLIYFGIEIRQVTPSSSLEIIVPGKTMPRQAIELQPMQARVLSAVELRNMFNHVRSEDIVMPANLFSDVTSGAFGNLPEGTDEISMYVYRWDPRLTAPVLVNNPAASKCLFTVCYEAKAPQWIMPVSTGEYESMDIATLSKQSPMLQWLAPVVNCDPKPRTYTYDIKVVQQMPLQAYDQAIENNPTVYQATGLTMPQCMIPTNIISKFSTVETYVAQITTKSNATQQGALGYIHLQNDGKSDLKIFRVKDYTALSNEDITYSAPEFTAPTPVTELAGKDHATVNSDEPTLVWAAPKANGSSSSDVKFSYILKIVHPALDEVYGNDDAEIAVEELEADYLVEGLTTTSHTLPESFMERCDSTVYIARVYAVPDKASEQKGCNYIYENGGKSAPSVFYFSADNDSIDLKGLGGKVLADSLYNFVNPEIILPRYSDMDGARKEFLNSDVAIEWRKPYFEGGRGTQPDTLKFVYDVELYSSDTYQPRTEMLKLKPVWRHDSLTVTVDTLHISSLEGKVSKGDYMLLRISPRVLNEKSVHYLNDSINIVDFALTDRLSQRYFQCANQVEIENEKPTSKKAADLKGKSVRIGEYELVLDGKLKDIGDGKFSGTGHVIWEPLALTWKLAVKFDSISVNTEDQVYKGLVVTYGGDSNPMTSSQVVDSLFSDWGIDNLIGDTGIPYANKLQNIATDKIKGLAEKYNLAEYYKDIQDGKALIEGLLDGNVENVTFPLEIPKKLNSTPVNLQISTMKFAPTYATMDLIGTFVVPETKATHNQILVFGAPRLCISPKSLIPEAGAVSLLKDFEVLDPKTGYRIKFKAPQNVTEPADEGCFLSWSDNKFEVLNVDLDMTMPDDLKKVVNGTVTDDSVHLRLKTTISDWNDWTAMGSLDAFEHVDLPGYVFTADNVVVDYSQKRNELSMGNFPSDFKMSDAGITNGSKEAWRGLYMKELSMQFPSSIKVGNGKEPMKVMLQNMFIDKSGLTVDCGIVNAINYKTGEEGTIGGFSFTMDTVRVSVLQNDFRDFGFNGKLQIPMFKGTIQYACNIYNQTFTKKGTGKGYAYVFKTHQIENLDFDFMLGNLSLDKKMTYFLVEATPNDIGALETNVELCVGGEVTIAGADMVNKKLAKLPMNLTLPEIKFCNMRIANNKNFTSVYESTMQETARQAAKATVLSMKSEWTKSNKDDDKTGVTSEAEGELENTKNLYWSFGQWGYSSPQKKIGPFKFELKGWNFKLNKEGNESYVGITLDGAVSFCDELKISASTKLEFQAWVRNLSKVKGVGDISKLSLEYKEVKFHEATFGVSTVGFKLEGTLECAGDGTSDKGYTGTLKADIAEGLFKVDVMGGYYDHEEDNNNYSWGFFNIKLGGTCGIPIPPLKISDISGGLYFNCKYNAKDEAHPTPKKGVIGIIAGMGMGTADGVTFQGKMEMVCVVEKSGDSYGLTSFIFNGDVSCMKGLITSKVSMEYESNDKDQYFQLNITAEASAEGALKGVKDKMNALEAKLKALKEDVDVASESVQKSLAGVFADKQTKSAAYNQNMDNYEKKQNEDKSSSSTTVGKVTVSLDLRIQTKKDGKDLSTCLWHVYLGKPTESERCQFILVDFNTKIVKVGVGANAYLCIGSELPDDGELPPIPTKVRQFLDGGQHGTATSDDISKAETGRTSAKAKFFANAKVDGGVMLGASVWGYVEVDLGLFYGDMGITAGFDISVRKLSGSSKCTNTGDVPGKKGWYGEGQLYAYLYAKFGFNINLGFFKKKFDAFDAGLGGVLRCALPNPNYFTGKARMKLKMLGGLINIDKSFEFECGNVCDLYLGGALDNYKLFESCNIGSETLDDAKKNPIEWEVQRRPVVYTQADLNSTIRVIDPTDRERIANSSAGNGRSDNALDDMASRSFMFSMYGSTPVLIKEYDSEKNVKQNKVANSYNAEYTVDRNTITIDFSKFKKNKIYCLTVKGKAWEFYNSAWRNTQQWDSLKNKYEPVEWTQSKDFWIVTNNEDERKIDDKDDLQKYVAVAYPNMPSNGTIGKQIIYGSDFMAVDMQSSGSVSRTDYPNPSAIEDIERPTISLTKKLKNKLYCNDTDGKLTWILVDKTTGEKQTRDNLWIEEGGVSILTPKTNFYGIYKGSRYVIRLVYEWTENVTGAWTWTPYKTYVVYGSSRAEVYKMYAKAFNATIKTNVGNIRTSNRQPLYRVDVQQVNLMNVTGAESNVFDEYGTYDDSYKAKTSSSSFSRNTSTSNAGQLKFKVTIYKYGQKTFQRKHFKNLAFMNADAYRSYPTTTDYFDDAPLYSRYFQAEVLQNFVRANDEFRSYYYDTYFVGQLKRDAYFPTFSYGARNVMPRVLMDPRVYLSYLSGMFFIGGHRFESGKNDLNYSKMSLQSLYIQSRYGDWQETLGDKNSNYQIMNGYSRLTDKTFMYLKLLRSKTGSTYPLYTNGSQEYVSALGTKSDARLTDYHSLNRKTYTGIIVDLYNSATTASKKINNLFSTYYYKYNKATWRNYLQSYAGSTLDLAPNSTWFTVKVPRYQFAVVWNGANLDGMNISKTIKLTGNASSYRHPRIDKGDQFGRRLYASALNQMSYAPSDCQNYYKYLLFNGAAVSKINNYLLSFYCYRVNAWDIDNQQWTVYTGNNVPYFTATKTARFLNLVSKYRYLLY